MVKYGLVPFDKKIDSSDLGKLQANLVSHMHVVLARGSS